MPRRRDDETELDPEDEVASETLGQVYLVYRWDDRLDVVPLTEGGEVVVGRTEGTILIDSPRVSRRHARIALDGGRVVVEDLGSRNGTRIGAAVVRSEKREATSGD